MNANAANETVEAAVKRGVQTSIIGICVNFTLAVIKIAAGYFGNSYALIADGIESSSDVVSSAIVLSGIKFSSLPPDENHPYGHGKAEPLAAVLVGLALLCAAAVIARASVDEIMTPHHAPAPFTLVVLALVIGVKEMLFRRVLCVGNSVQSTAIKGDAWHHRSDAITSLAAFVGISIALIGGPGYEEADDWAALVAVVIIGITGFRVLLSAIYELSDAAPDPQIMEQVKNVARTVPGVVDLEKCSARKMGFSYYVDLHVTVDGNLSVREGHRIAHRVKDAIRAAYPRVVEALIHIEPDTY